jgi:hypothetical protein
MAENRISASLAPADKEAVMQAMSTTSRFSTRRSANASTLQLEKSYRFWLI